MDTPKHSSIADTQPSPFGQQLKAKHMSIEKMLNLNNTTVSQLPTPDVSPEQITIKDPEEDVQNSPSDSQDSPRDPLLFSPSVTSPPASNRGPLFQVPESQERLPSPAQILAQSNDSLDSPPRILSSTPGPYRWLTEIGTTSNSDGTQNRRLQSNVWGMAAKDHRRFNALKKASDLTYTSKGFPMLNVLADAAVYAAAPKPPVAVQKRRRVAKPKTEVTASPSTPREGLNREVRVRRNKRANDDELSDAAPKRLRAEPKAKDKPSHWSKVVDYCPPIRIDADRLASAREKTGTDSDVKHPIDLSKDPDVRLLHDLELRFAYNHRLDCNKYLINKRLIFKAKVNSIIQGTTFSKTHAQQAGIIDVNKSSKIWEFFKAAGWFENHIFEAAVKQERQARTVTGTATA